MSLDVQGFKDFIQNFEKLSQTIDVEIEKFFYEIALKALARTKKRTPVLTGDLRKQWVLSNIQRNGNNLTVILSNPLDYASYVEFGHRVDKHYVPGEWKGKRFVYNPNSNKGVVMGTKTAWIEGKFMATISLKEIQESIPKEWDKRFKQLLGGAI
ncbi:HK97 gp10 family phage protein [Pseudobacteroides cellulosolvens]|uniref:Protein HK97 gp10 family protein n=1 Tax=Pseudobacteroides cellulosolvens ATCC 35603 = DSM 2933 TaxID=398512 RepID=A0A0L6JLQ9_9FIRM|nr:HK97 gp10 family phage protein [Pseudobacteroides cellulosolvens]KNY26327.1 protein HK97 gp10 family protein [Pseudobacteroides cellulosolvens ATCC 35603 = DSM 2933]